MRISITPLWQKIKTGTPRPLRYLLSGGTALLTNIALLAFFVEIAGLWYLVAAALAFAIALVVSFTLQKFFTFADHARTQSVLTRQFSIYTTVALANIALNTLLMYLLVEYVSLHYILAQISASAAIAFYSFFIYKILFKAPSIINHAEIPTTKIPTQQT